MENYITVTSRTKKPVYIVGKILLSISKNNEQTEFVNYSRKQDFYKIENGFVYYFINRINLTTGRVLFEKNIKVSNSKSTLFTGIRVPEKYFTLFIEQ